LFTPRVVAVILLLVAFTILPTITNWSSVVQKSGRRAAADICLCFYAVDVCGRTLSARIAEKHPGAGRHGIGQFGLFFNRPGLAAHASVENIQPVALFFSHLNTSLVIEPGVLVAFILCFLACQSTIWARFRRLDWC
jgi:hypothetical protein